MAARVGAGAQQGLGCPLPLRAARQNGLGNQGYRRGGGVRGRVVQGQRRGTWVGKGLRVVRGTPPAADSNRAAEPTGHARASQTAQHVTSGRWCTHPRELPSFIGTVTPSAARMPACTHPPHPHPITHTIRTHGADHHPNQREQVLAPRRPQQARSH
jgi:hypothetical protein